MKAFYHSADLDGHCSGALIKMVYPECEMIGINYGDEFPWDDIEKDEIIYMVDFSLQPFKYMIKLQKKCKLIWIDHHKSAIEEYDKANFEGKVPKIAGNQKSGIGACQLVWEYFDKGLPTFIKLLAEYDVWDHSDSRTLPFQWGMRQFADTSPDNQEFWKSLFDVEEVVRITEVGGIILKYQQVENEKYIKACGFDLEFDGLKCIAVNKMLTNSMLFTSVWNPEEYDAMLTFGYRNGKWTICLYSDKEDIDISGIAKARNGGGHKGAAGFQSKTLPFKI